MPIAPDYLIRLQNQPSLVRNICILAHVDHGKTSLSDNLLASNGIISQAMQGQIRYLDSRADEQERGITMESSAISLYFRILKKLQDQEQPETKEYLINLVDSPGHIDFSSEVSTASRLCDGAVIVVDVVEGVCSQTVTVLRQAWVDKMKPILVLNKMDRLISELQMTPTEAFHHLARTIEQVNAIVGTFYQGQRMEEDMKWRERLEQGVNQEFVESSDEDIYFAPEKNNVVFGSAVDGWGFNISQFAAIYERKLGMNRAKLEKVLWGENYLDPKTKSVISGQAKLKGRNLKPLFVQLVLDNIWAVYNSCLQSETTKDGVDREKAEKIVTALGLKVNPRDIKTKDGTSLLHTIVGQWIPLSRAILLSVVDILPSPVDAQRERIPMILEATPNHESVDKSVTEAMEGCDKDGPVTAYISKVVAFPAKDIPTERKVETDTVASLREKSQRARELAQASSQDNVDEDELEYLADKTEDLAVDEKIIGFARIYSGTLRVGEEVTLLNPKFDPAKPRRYYERVTVTGLFMLMGRDMIPIDTAPAGNIVGIGGLDGKILKTGTLVSGDVGGPNLASTNVAAPPILRVAVEPADPTKMDELEQGLKLLNISDPCVQVTVLETGEFILATAGELHLERCIKDLKERYAKVDITSSKPIVPYRETIVDQGEWDEEEEEGVRGEVEIEAGAVKIKLQVYPLTQELTDYVVANADKIRGLDAKKREIDEEELDEEIEMEGGITTDAAKLDEVRRGLDQLLVQHKTDSIVSFGPRRVGPNILFDATGKISRRAWPKFEKSSERSQFEDGILSGFQMAMSRGNLMAEPLEGVGCVIASITESEQSATSSTASTSTSASTSASASGRLYSIIRDNILRGVKHWSPRIKLAQYLCDIQAPTEVLGKLYGVVTKRRGRVLSEEMNEGTPFFVVRAKIPVEDAFGFSAEVRKRTSGAANPQLVYAGFETLDQDPFWVPTTEEELEELGELADRENVAMVYMNAVRRRKGLSVAEKVVQRGEQQRTMKK